jgi:hypothetical protein
MRHGADSHANFTFGTQRALYFEHFILGERILKPVVHLPINRLNRQSQSS